MTTLVQCVRQAIRVAWLSLALFLAPLVAAAAPYAALVMDARTGEVLYSTNADTRLHPASLTKMMTLYIAFEAIERGEISLDSMVTVSQHAASQAPSRLGLRPGQRIALRYLIRAAAIKSANDAAVAIGEAISGSEPAFAKRMTRTAKALGMTRTTFKNANGLTAEGHLSTARDMTILGRRLFYDFPQYYNIFSRRSADAGMATVNSTNRRFLDSYEGADGIKTGYTVPAGYNLTASAQHGNKRIIATIFGGRSTAQRNAKMAELLDLGFSKAPNRAGEQRPEPPVYMADASEVPADDHVATAVADAVAEDMTEGGKTRGVAAGKTIRVALAVSRSIRPKARPEPGAAAAEPELVAAAEAAAQPEPPPVPADAGQTVGELARSAPPAPEAPEAAAPGAEDPVAVAGADTSTLPVADTEEAVRLAMQESIEAALEDAQGTQLAAAEGETLTGGEEDGPTFVQTAEPQPETMAMAFADPLAVPAAASSGISPKPRPDLPEAGTVVAGDAGAIVAAAPDPAATPDLPQPAGDASAGQEPVMADADPALPAPPAGADGEPEREEILLASIAPAGPTDETLEVVTRVSTSGGRNWGISVGKYASRYEAERVLLQTALLEMSTLDEALRKVANRKGGFDALFVGMTADTAELACRRLQARSAECTVIGPQG